MTKKIIWVIVVAIIVIIAAYLVFFYNSLIKQSQAIDGQWAQVENQFQRRFDLIPNLVNSVQGAMSQEQEVFLQIAEARTRYSGAQTTDEKAAAASQVETALGRLLVIIENYPQLKSIEAVQMLMVQLEGTENRIAVERGRFNDLVRNYNTAINQIPGRFFASLFGFNQRKFFQAVQGAEQAPQVEFNQ